MIIDYNTFYKISLNRKKPPSLNFFRRDVLLSLGLNIRRKDFKKLGCTTDIHLFLCRLFVHGGLGILTNCLLDQACKNRTTRAIRGLEKKTDYTNKKNSIACTENSFSQIFLG